MELKDVGEWLVKAVPPRLTSAIIALVTGLLLFLPNDWLIFLALDQLVVGAQPWVSLGFIVSSALLVVLVAAACGSQLRSWWEKKQEAKAQQQQLEEIEQEIALRLNQLTEEEKKILRYYIGHQTKTNVLRVDCGVAAGLRDANIIYYATNIGSHLDGIAHNIGAFAWDLLNSKPELLEGESNTARTDKGAWRNPRF